MNNRMLRAALFAAAVALPSTAGHSQDAAPRTAVPQFEQHFATYAELPDAPQPGRGVADLDTFEPPVEAEPATTSLGSGTASYYGRKFHGRRTASGEAFDMTAMTAAHRTLPFGSRVLVTNPRTGASVVVTINDRGPFHGSRIIDVSRAAADELGITARGKGTVELALLES